MIASGVQRQDSFIAFIDYGQGPQAVGNYLTVDASILLGRRGTRSGACADTTRMRQLLNWTPQVDIDTDVRHYLQCRQSQPTVQRIIQASFCTEMTCSHSATNRSAASGAAPGSADHRSSNRSSSSAVRVNSRCW